MEKFLTLMLALQTRVAERDEKGQGTLEYVGIVVIAALLVGAIVAAINPGEITGKIQEKISEILNAG